MIKLGKSMEYVYSLMEEDIEKQIREGILSPGESILSENKLCEKYRISRRSVRQAIGNLIKKRLLYRVPGKGTFVTEMAERNDEVDGYAK